MTTLEGKALEVVEVKTCKCRPDCPEIPTKGREYAWGHKGGAKASAEQDLPITAKDSPSGMVFTVRLTEAGMDAIWSGLTAKRKAELLGALL